MSATCEDGFHFGTNSKRRFAGMMDQGRHRRRQPARLLLLLVVERSQFMRVAGSTATPPPSSPWAKILRFQMSLTSISFVASTAWQSRHTRACYYYAPIQQVKCYLTICNSLSSSNRACSHRGLCCYVDGCQNRAVHVLDYGLLRTLKLLLPRPA